MAAIKSPNPGAPRTQRGFSMLEILISIVIISTGLLGLAGLQAYAQKGEFESYQRAQAIILLNDVVEKIAVMNRAALCFAQTNATTGAPYFGTGATADLGACNAGTAAENALADQTMTAWSESLAGAGAQKSGTEVGAMLGGRGCVSYDASSELTDPTTGVAISGTGEFRVSVSWQGGFATVTPAANCGNGLYGGEGLRRTITTTFRVAKTI